MTSTSATGGGFVTRVKEVATMRFLSWIFFGRGDFVLFLVLLALFPISHLWSKIPQTNSPTVNTKPIAKKAPKDNAMIFPWETDLLLPA